MLLTCQKSARFAAQRSTSCPVARLGTLPSQVWPQQSSALLSRLDAAHFSRPGTLESAHNSQGSPFLCSSFVGRNTNSAQRCAGSMAQAQAYTIRTNTTGIHISSSFDSGNIEVVECSNAADIQLRIRSDPFCQSDNSAHYQWFYYRVTGCRAQPLKMNIINAGGASFPEAWDGYSTAASYDGDSWFRIPTSYDATTGVLSITHTPEHDAIFYGYFAPYSQDRHLHFVHRCQASGGAVLHMLGRTLDGRDIEMLQFGEDGPSKRKIWFVSRQHPGESMAEWYTEGLMERLMDRDDGTARKLLQQCVFYVIPNINPDGSFRGYLRTNAAGANLNREWAEPSAERSPEVLCVRDAMRQRGVDMLVDVHGDEALPYNFLAHNEGIPGWSERLAKLSDTLTQAYLRATPDFQDQYGYPKHAPGRANMSLCSKHVGGFFDCLAVTLEMPFKDTDNHPHPATGWSPQRAKRFGAAILGPVLEVLPMLR